MGSEEPTRTGTPPLADRVSRPRLVEGLLAATIAVVEAGAGFWKSTLAREYGDTAGCTVVYVAVGDADGDAATLS